MFAIGPEWQYTIGGGEVTNSVAGVAQLDFPFWRLPERKFGLVERARIVCGIVSQSAFLAVFSLATSSNLVGGWTSRFLWLLNIFYENGKCLFPISREIKWAIFYRTDLGQPPTIFMCMVDPEIREVAIRLPLGFD